MNELATAPYEGKLTQPFKEITQAIAAASTLPGDTLLVAPGVYDPFIVSKRPSIRSTDGPLVTGTKSAQATNIKTVRYLSAAQFSTLEGFTV